MPDSTTDNPEPEPTMTRSTGQRRHLATSSTQADFTTLTPVRANGRFADYAGTLTPTGRPSWKLLRLDGYRGVRLGFMGSGVDNNAFSYRIWTAAFATRLDAAFPVFPTGDIAGVQLRGFGFGVATLGSNAGASATDAVLNTELYADTLTFTLCTSGTVPPGPASVIATAYALGDPVVFSPADQTPAGLIIPDFGSGVDAILIEFALSSATGANATYELTA